MEVRSLVDWKAAWQVRNGIEGEVSCQMEHEDGEMRDSPKEWKVLVRYADVLSSCEKRYTCEGTVVIYF